ncbi:hypothetical protein [Nocardia farcinica]|uniref:hypothetical protein n=1 Tax=Nocardia farcinica TaxID=37329 RepID=UPI0024570FDF|nr:hypothetical protein [Nocardia farcinica]
MGNDEQLVMDLGVPVERTAWGKWVDPERHRSQMQTFMEYAGLQRLPPEPWPEDSEEVRRLNSIVAGLFPELNTAMSPERADISDAFICFVGACFIEFAGAEWVDYEWFGGQNSFYDHVNPALRFDTPDEDEFTIWGLMDDMIDYNREDHEGMFSYIAAALREYATYHEEAHRPSM